MCHENEEGGRCIYMYGVFWRLLSEVFLCLLAFVIQISLTDIASHPDNCLCDCVYQQIKVMRKSITLPASQPFSLFPSANYP